MSERTQFIAHDGESESHKRRADDADAANTRSKHVANLRDYTRDRGLAQRVHFQRKHQPFDSPDQHQSSAKNLFTTLFNFTKPKTTANTNANTLSNEQRVETDNMKASKHAAAGDRHRHQMIDVDHSPLKNNNNKSHSGSADHLANDLESNTPKTQTGFCRSACKCVFILMAIAFIVVAIAFAILSYTTVTNDNGANLCNQHQNVPFQDDYHLFATKTLYTAAFTYLSKPSQQAANYLSPSATTSQTTGHEHDSQQHVPPPSHQQQLPTIKVGNNNAINIPNIFSKKFTLEALNQRLLDEGCQAKRLYFYARHAARYPNSDDRDQMIKSLEIVKRQLDLLKQQQDRDKKANQQSTIELSTPTAIANQATVQNQSHADCDPFAKFRQYELFTTHADQANLLTGLGVLESHGLAERLKQIYPQFFDGDKTNINVGVTDKRRTSQTAIEFIKSFSQFHKLDEVCPLQSFPSNELASSPAGARQLNDDKCLGKFSEIFGQPSLSFHTSCNPFGDIGPKNFQDLKLDEQDPTKFIVDSVNKQLKLDTYDTYNGDQGALTQTPAKLTAKEVQDLYSICKFESALNGSESVWCSLFDQRARKFYEYLNDIKDYYTSAYGSELFAKSACFAFNDMRRLLDEILYQKLESLTQEAYFFFTHSEVLQRILAATFDLSNEVEYSHESVKKYLSEQNVPKNREWRTSLFTPFSANIAYTIYQCNDNSTSIDIEPVPQSSRKPQHIDFDSKVKDKYKLVASLNEQPVMITGCYDYACALSAVNRRSRLRYLAISNDECVHSRVCNA